MHKPWITDHPGIVKWATLIQNIEQLLSSILIKLQQYDSSSKSGYERIQEEDIQQEIRTSVSILIENCQLTGASKVIPTLVNWYFLVSLLNDTSPSVGPYISYPESRNDDEDGYHQAIKELITLKTSLEMCSKDYWEFSKIIFQAISMSPHLVNQWKKKVRSIL